MDGISSMCTVPSLVRVSFRYADIPHLATAYVNPYTDRPAHPPSNLAECLPQRATLRCATAEGGPRLKPDAASRLD